MKLRQITIAGFRGFNQERTIQFHEKLTLIGAQNSYGKTSISEALEFLLFGSTSKVEHADSKDEYRDSYRNRHYPPDKSAYIEATLEHAENSMDVLRVELDSFGEVRKFFNGAQVDQWPFSGDLEVAAKPFILQHALKYLLLVMPTDRFQGFARLLGLNEVDRVHQALVNLCTKPEASISIEAKKALESWQGVDARLKAYPKLDKVSKAFKKTSGVDDGYKALKAHAEILLGMKSASSEALLAGAIRVRDEAVAKIYAGTIKAKTLSESELNQLADQQQLLSSAVSSTFIADYTTLAGRGVTERLQREAKFLDLGAECSQDEPHLCPYCGQQISEATRVHILERHEELKLKIGETSASTDVRSRVRSALNSAQAALDRHRRSSGERVSDLLVASKPENQARIVQLLGDDHKSSWETVETTIRELAPLLTDFQTAGEGAAEVIKSCGEAIQSRKEEVDQVEALGRAIDKYLEAAAKFNAAVNQSDLRLAVPARSLALAIDKLAGTAELNLVIELFEARKKIEKSLQVRDLLAGLKDLKRHVDQTVGETMEAAINSELTSSVMTWYGMIRTSGDPDVHFSGFAMERTKAGDFKSRRLKVQAQSYGVELASAVSSLSESKLNALGLCVSIASALRTPGPWKFLLLDDPIQSWDDDHETQFINVIRNLAEQQGKQIILLSHKTEWINQVRLTCRTLNGCHYQITGYTKDGPRLAVKEWSPIKQRLLEANSIANDSSSTDVRLQQAAEEVRLAACQLASQIALKSLSRETSPHNMNGGDVRTILTQAGFEAELIDKVSAAYADSDAAHHAPKLYRPNAERIRQSVGILQGLLNKSGLS